MSHHSFKPVHAEFDALTFRQCCAGVVVRRADAKRGNMLKQIVQHSGSHMCDFNKRQGFDEQSRPRSFRQTVLVATHAGRMQQWRSTKTYCYTPRKKASTCIGDWSNARAISLATRARNQNGVYDGPVLHMFSPVAALQGQRRLVQCAN